MSIACRDIQRRLIVDRYRRGVCMPNYTPLHWWECDVFELTEAGFFREYEIKLTRSDFKADAKKQKDRWLLDGGSYKVVPGDKKHDQIAKGDTKGPVQFWFVCPTGLLTLADVPDWAGLLTAEPFGHRAPYAVHIREEKKAPRLHNTKADVLIKSHLESVCYYRYLHLFNHPTEGDQPCPDQQ